MMLTSVSSTAFLSRAVINLFYNMDVEEDLMLAMLLIKKKGRRIE